MKKLLLIISLLAACQLQMEAQGFSQSDSTKSGIRNYVDEIGYFQIANRDMGDPRFMFHDAKGKVDFGIGGTAKIQGFYGFGGEVPSFKFNPMDVVIPTEKTGLFAARVSGCDIYFKARSFVRDHKIISFIKLGGNDDNTIALKEAYISLDGFSIGLIPSFFMDREVGPMTTGVTSSKQIDKTHTLIGYTADLSDKWRVGAAVEMPWLDLTYYPEAAKVFTYYQSIPDIAAYIKYRFPAGHLHFGVLGRGLCYCTGWSDEIEGNEYHYGKSLGIGGTFSGSLRFSEKTKVTWQFAGGQGIASYLSDLSNLYVDIGLEGLDTTKKRTMSSIPVSTGMVSFEYNWTESLTSALLLTHSHIYRKYGIRNFNDSKDSICLSANLFWYLNEYTYLGGEYNFAYRNLYGNLSGANSGIANRISAVFAFCF